jgi:hypothetical protein
MAKVNARKQFQAVVSNVAGEPKTIDIGSVAANTIVTGTVTITGAALGDIAFITPTADDAAFDNITLTAFVESANTVKWVAQGDGTGGDPASQVYNIMCLRPDYGN